MVTALVEIGANVHQIDSTSQTSYVSPTKYEYAFAYFFLSREEQCWLAAKIGKTWTCCWT